MNILGIGMLLGAIGFIGLVYGLIMRARAGRVSDAAFVKTGEAAAKGTAAANPKGAISVEGNVTCAQPLVAPVSGKTCLFYDIKVTAEWKDGDTNKTKELSHEKRAAQFGIDDGSGPVWIDAKDGGDFEPAETKVETKSTGLLGGITGQDLMFGQFRVSTGMLSLGTKYRVEEKILSAAPKLYVCGKAGSNNEITQPSWGRSLLITGKTRADYLGHAMQTAKIALIVAASLMGVGTVLGIVGAVVGGGDEGKKATAANATAAAAANTQAPAATAASPTAAATAVTPASTGAAAATNRPATAPGKTPPKRR